MIRGFGVIPVCHSSDCELASYSGVLGSSSDHDNSGVSWTEAVEGGVSI
jgi:hypothetical protein